MGRVPFNGPYAPTLSTIYDGAQGSLNFLKMVLDPSPPPLQTSTTPTSYTCAISNLIYQHVGLFTKYLPILASFLCSFFSLTQQVFRLARLTACSMQRQTSATPFSYTHAIFNLTYLRISLFSSCLTQTTRDRRVVVYIEVSICRVVVYIEVSICRQSSCLPISLYRQIKQLSTLKSLYVEQLSTYKSLYVDIYI